MMSICQEIVRLARPLLWKTDLSGRPSYRADLDGLRGISIVIGVLFHAFPTLLPGGFVLIEVFFVISGFLITDIILKNLQKGRFNLFDFWARRIRRIFPAFLTVITAVFAAGWIYLLPAEFASLKSHIRWGLGFLANFNLKSEVNYFATAANLKPLVHLWSLAIEEQFYFVWPGLLWLCHRRKMNLLAITLLLTLLSFGCYRWLPYTPTESFYLTWTRIWEIQIGALIAISHFCHGAWEARLAVILKQNISALLRINAPDAAIDAPLRNIISITGFLFVVYAWLTFEGASSFPSTRALIPVLGAAMMVAAGEGCWFNRTILSL